MSCDCLSIAGVTKKKKQKQIKKSEFYLSFKQQIYRKESVSFSKYLVFLYHSNLNMYLLRNIID